MRVLVVEDLLAALVATKAILCQYGFEVDTAMDGPEGLNKALNTTYSFVVMDIGLPYINGIEASRQIRAAGIMTPVFALTANLGEHPPETLLAAGMEVGYEKPLNAYKVADILYRCRIFPPKNEAILLGKLPGIDLREDIFERSGVLYDELDIYRPLFEKETIMLEAMLETAFQAANWSELRNNVDKLYEDSLYLGSLRLTLACRWLYDSLSNSVIHPEQINYYYQLMKQSLTQYLIDYREEYEIEP